MTDKIISEAQFNILKPHGREHVWSLFFKFDDVTNSVSISDWISDFIAAKVTSAKDQNTISQNYKTEKNCQSKPVFGFYLSKQGYIKLGYNRNKYERIEKNNYFDTNWEGNTAIPKHAFFREEMSERKDLFDVPKENWEQKFKENWSGMILIAADEEVQLIDLLTEIELSLIDRGTIVSIQKGQRLYYQEGGKKYSIEPFGYRDGLTKISFFTQNNPKELLKNRWKLALDDQYGSYLVFRKLEQDIALFNEKIDNLKNELGISRAYAEAQVMGRFKDGTPLALFKNPSAIQTEEDQNKLSKFNHYFFDPNLLTYRKPSNFDLDPEGIKCPFHAHIRKINPRKPYRGKGAKSLEIKSVQDYQNLPKPIIRRSIPYDDSGNQNTKGSGVGLLFMCFQRNIEKQFIQIQKSWCNDESPSYDEIQQQGIDPIAGQHKNIQNVEVNKNNNTFSYDRSQKWNKEWNSNKIVSKNISFKDIVKLKGGGFFYAPPISFIKQPLGKKLPIQIPS